MNKIFSQRITKDYDGFDFEFDVWFDKTSNEWWFAFDDICTSIQFKRSAGHKYFTGIDEEEKCNLLDMNYINQYGERCPAERSFINYNALINLLDRNRKRMNAFANVVNGIVFYTDIKLDDSGLEEAICELGDAFNDKNLENIIEGARKVVHKAMGKLNDDRYSKELTDYIEWLESDNEMFIAHKENNVINTWQDPTIDEALDILYKAGLGQ